MQDSKSPTQSNDGTLTVTTSQPSANDTSEVVTMVHNQRYDDAPSPTAVYSAIVGVAPDGTFTVIRVDRHGYIIPSNHYSISLMIVLLLVAILIAQIFYGGGRR